MIYGVGIDILDVDRIGSRSDVDVFARKVLSDLELEIYRALDNFTKKRKYLAKQFSSKEAVAKALGTGFDESITPTKVQILRDKLGKPLVVFDNTIEDIVHNMGISSVHLSISDEKQYVIALAVAESTVESMTYAS